MTPLSLKPVNQLDTLNQSGLFNFPVLKCDGREFISRGRKFFDFCSTNYLSYEFDPYLHEEAGRKPRALNIASIGERPGHLTICAELKAASSSGISGVKLIFETSEFRCIRYKIANSKRGCSRSVSLQRKPRPILPRAWFLRGDSL